MHDMLLVSIKDMKLMQRITIFFPVIVPPISVFHWVVLATGCKHSPIDWSPFFAMLPQLSLGRVIRRHGQLATKRTQRAAGQPVDVLEKAPDMFYIGGLDRSCFISAKLASSCGYWRYTLYTPETETWQAGKS